MVAIGVHPVAASVGSHQSCRSQTCSANATRRYAAEVYLDRDLAATPTSNAHLHDSACGDLRAGDSTVRRLRLRPPCGIPAVDLDKANQPGEAGQACDGPGRVGGRTPDPTQASTSAVAPAPQAAARLATWQQARATVRLTVGVGIGIGNGVGSEPFNLAALTRSGRSSGHRATQQKAPCSSGATLCSEPPATSIVLSRIMLRRTIIPP
jgi:hypothetical protein